MKLNHEQNYLDSKNNILNQYVIAYKKLVLKYLKKGIYWNDFYNETTELYDTRLEEFNKKNKTYLIVLNVFNKLLKRYFKNSFNASFNDENFDKALQKAEITKDNFIRSYSIHNALKDIQHVHSINKDNLSLFSSIYYNSILNHRVNINNLPIFLEADGDEIIKYNNRLNNILYPQPKKQELYPLTLFGIKFTVREAATLIIFIRNHYNINPKRKSDFLEIAYLIFGDINLELKLNTPSNNSALYDFIKGKRLFVDSGYKYEDAKSKIIKALSYKNTTKFDRLKSYIEKQNLKTFKGLIK